MLLLLPTDTCYGLSGALMREDYEEIYRLKWRDFSKQLAILVRDFSDMKKYIEISDEQIEFLRVYPYPWSFLGKRNPIASLPDCMDPYKYEKISLRVALSCIDANIRDTIEYPLFLTSANLSGASESKTLIEAKIVFPGIEGIDGGVCENQPSDIFSLREDGTIFYLRRNYNPLKTL